MKIKIEHQYDLVNKSKYERARIGEFVEVIQKRGGLPYIELDYWDSETLTPQQAAQLQEELRIAVLLCQRLAAESDIESLNEVTIA